MSGLDIPDTVDAATVTEWSDDVDVVVIGFGIGGGCAAVTAAAAGARVLVLERAAATSTLVAVPLCSRPPGTPIVPRRCTSTW